MSQIAILNHGDQTHARRVELAQMIEQGSRRGDAP